MFIRNSVVFLLNSTFDCTFKRIIYNSFYRSFSGFKCRYLCSYKNTVHFSSTVKKNDSTNKPKPSNILADLKVSVNDVLEETTDSVKHLSQDISSSEKFIKLMRCEGDFDMNGVISTLEHYNLLKLKLIWKKKYKDEIKSSPEFNKFLHGLEKNISNLEGHNLVSALSCLQCFGLSKNADLFSLITLRIIENINDLKLEDAALILGLIRLIDEENNNEEDILINELSQELKLKIHTVLTKRLDSLKESELKSILKFIRSDYCEWPDEAFIKLLNSCFSSTTIWQYTTSFGLIYFVTSHLKDEYKKKEFQLRIILKLFDTMLNTNHMHAYMLCYFIQDYSVLVFNAREPFDEKLFNSVMDTIMTRSKMTMKELHYVVSATILSRYIRTDVLEQIKKTLFSDMIYNHIHQYFPSRNEYFSFYRNCLDIIVCSKFKISQRELNRFQSYFKNHPILINVDEWKDVSELKSLRLALSLAALDIFPNEILEYLFQNIHLDDEDGNHRKNSLLIRLNQAAALLTNQRTSFLKESKIADFKAQKYTDDEVLNANVKVFESFVNDMKEIFKILKISFIPNVYTQLGHNIAFVVASNNRNQFFDFKSLASVEKINIEELSVPSGYKLKLVLPFLDNDYCRNWLTLRSDAVVSVKSLKAMEYETVLILHDNWGDLSSEGKKKFLINKLNCKSRN